ncbi:MAG: methyltransferase [Phycisphaerae bacterium]|jgi:predicted O-methyltransferase YrrM
MPKEWGADDLLTMARGYQPAIVLAAAAELELYDLLADVEATAETVAEQAGADVRATTIILDALAALGIIEKRGARYHLSADAARWLTTDSPDSVVPMLQHQANCVRRWVQLAAVAKTGRPADRYPGIRGAERDEASFIQAMNVVCAPIASRLVEELRLPTLRHLLDVGGASGTWTIAFLRAYPEATATLFDLPHVIPMAEQRLAAAGVRERVKLVAGDFTTDPLPTGADTVWVSAIVHQNSREENVHLFRSIADALPHQGCVLIRDVLMDSSRTAPVSGALFAINMLVATDGGNSYTFGELRGDLEVAGFSRVAVLRRDEGMDSVVEGYKHSGA